MSSPAICIFQGKEFHFSKCLFFFRHSVKSNLIESDNIFGSLHSNNYTCNVERFRGISDWAISVIMPIATPNTKVFLEGYAFASKGMINSLSENTFSLKSALYDNGFSVGRENFDIITPGMVKKLATGKGGAKKDKMLDAFVKETSFDIENIFPSKNNPSGDIVDAYYIAKYGYRNS